MPKLIAALLSIWAACAAASANAPPQQPAGAEEFMAAMRRVRTNLPEPPDSPALKDYPIYDYLVAERLRRDLAASPNQETDNAIDGFLRAHAAEPVAHALRHQWLASLAERRRWDWFLPRSADLTDPPLICDRLAGRLATGEHTATAAAGMRGRFRMAADSGAVDSGARGGAGASRAPGGQCAARARIRRRCARAARGAVAAMD
jgi:hypothetical protein